MRKLPSFESLIPCVLFSSGLFKIFCFVLVSVLWLRWVRAWLSSSSSYLKFAELLASANICSFIKCGKFSAIISSNKFLHHYFLLPFQGYNNTKVRSSNTVPQFFEALCIFYQTFCPSMFSRLGIFIDLPPGLSILFFLISILLLWSYGELSISVMVSIHSKFPFGSWHPFCFLAENFYLSTFESVHPYFMSSLSEVL